MRLVGLEETDRNAPINVEVNIPGIYFDMHTDNVEEEHIKVIGNIHENKELMKK
jgi:hypothetical protein